MRRISRFVFFASAASLASCGGEGGTGGAAPAPSANRPPAFTSSATASFVENSGAVAYAATAQDPDSDPLTFSISGGADAALFTTTAAGAVSFGIAPDFEAPGDANRDNVYAVQLAVSDGRTSVTLDVQITVTNLAGEAFQVRRVATGFAQPLFVTGIPGSATRVFVVEKGGRIRILDRATGAIAATPFLDISSDIATSGERGLLGLVPARDFATTGFFYVFATNTAGDNEIRRYRTAIGTPDIADPTSKDVILRIPHPGADNHNGGWIGFGPTDNLLYISSGDGGGSGDPSNNAQNTNSLLGKMLRIDVASDAFPADAARDYAIPAGNPFAASGGAPEVFAIGLRNPFRASFDTSNGALYIGDVGQGAVEEIDLIPAGIGGLNFGWRAREGSQPFNGGANSSAFTAPVAEYFHGNGPLQGNSITGGYVYRGPVLSLRGQYIFADFVSSNIWSVPVASLTQGQTAASAAFTRRNGDFTPSAGAFNNIASFGTDDAGNLFIVDLDGDIFVIEAS